MEGEAGHARGGPVPPGSAAGAGGPPLPGREGLQGRSTDPPLPFPAPTRLTRLGTQARPRANPGPVRTLAPCEPRLANRRSRPSYVLPRVFLSTARLKV